jgi:hypothetical protein
MNNEFILTILPSEFSEDIEDLMPAILSEEVL